VPRWVWIAVAASGFALAASILLFAAAYLVGSYSPSNRDGPNAQWEDRADLKAGPVNRDQDQPATTKEHLAFEIITEPRPMVFHVTDSAFPVLRVRIIPKGFDRGSHGPFSVALELRNPRDFAISHARAAKKEVVQDKVGLKRDVIDSPPEDNPSKQLRITRQEAERAINRDDKDDNKRVYLSEYRGPLRIGSGTIPQGENECLVKLHGIPLPLDEAVVGDHVVSLAVGGDVSLTDPPFRFSAPRIDGRVDLEEIKKEAAREEAEEKAGQIANIRRQIELLLRISK